MNSKSESTNKSTVPSSVPGPSPSFTSGKDPPCGNVELATPDKNPGKDQVKTHDRSQQQIIDDAMFAVRLADEETIRDVDCTNDAALALILQRQFDLEHNSRLDREEARLNGHSKVGVSLNKFRRSASGRDFDPDEPNETSDRSVDETESADQPAWDAFELEEIKRRGRTIGRQGFTFDEDGNMITKHDIPTSSRRNMCRLMELKTDIQTGDAGASRDDFRLNNYVYNHLKIHSKKSSRRASQRAFDKKERENAAILNNVLLVKMSDATRAIMDGLLIAFKIEKLNGVIGHGKESTIYHATGRDHEDQPGQEVAVKIFKSDVNVAFKTRDTYNKSKCPSYKFDKPKSKNDSLNKWAERGFKNLKSLRRAAINCPEAISLKRHVLIMTFLGLDAKPAPQLKDAVLDETRLQKSYEQVVDIMRRMHKDCELIHGDLSEYNLLWHNDEVYVIDVSQSMSTAHPNSNAFLFRDCKNILDFYRRSGLQDLVNERELFKTVCGKDLDENDIELLAKIQDFPQNEKLMERDQNSGADKSDYFADMHNSSRKNRQLLKSSKCDQTDETS